MSTIDRRILKLSTNHNGTLPGCAVHFDRLKVWKASVPVLPKNLLNSVSFRIKALYSDVVSGWADYTHHITAYPVPTRIRKPNDISAIYLPAFLRYVNVAYCIETEKII